MAIYCNIFADLNQAVYSPNHIRFHGIIEGYVPHLAYLPLYFLQPWPPRCPVQLTLLLNASSTSVVLLLGRRRRRHPSLDAFASLAAPMETRRLTGFTLRPTRHRTKAYDEVVPSRGLVHGGGPLVIRPIVTGPAWPPHITGLICKGFSVIIVCNLALWEYSGDNLGA